FSLCITFRLSLTASSLRSCFFFPCYGDHPHLHSFPTRRSSDLTRPQHRGQVGQIGRFVFQRAPPQNETGGLSRRTTGSVYPFSGRPGGPGTSISIRSSPGTRR